MSFFYFDNLYSLLGNNAIFYVGVYGFITDVTTDQTRAMRFGLYDAVELIGYWVGTFLSPKLHAMGGNYLNYSVTAAFAAIALVYLVVFVKDVERIKGDAASDVSLLRRCVIVPWQEFIRSLGKKRPGRKKLFLYLLLVVHSIFWGGGQHLSQLYLYMRKTFAGFTGADYADYLLYNQFVGIVGLLLGLPFAAKILKLSEATNGLCINFLITVGLLASAFVKNLWPDFYIARAFTALTICQYSVNRSFITKLIDKDEVGKVFAAVGIITTLCPLALDPLFKIVYNATLSSLPSAFLLLAAGFYSINVSILLAAWCFREELLAER